MLDMDAAVTAMRLVLSTCVQPVTRAVCLVLAMHQGAQQADAFLVVGVVVDLSRCMNLLFQVGGGCIVD